MTIKSNVEARNALEELNDAFRRIDRAPDAIRFAALRANFAQLLAQIPSDVGGQLTSATWSGLADSERDRLSGKLDEFAAAADLELGQIECNQPGSLMSRDCVGNGGIGLLLSLAVIGIILTLAGIHSRWSDATGPSASKPELQANFERAKEETSELAKRLAALKTEVDKSENELKIAQQGLLGTQDAVLRQQADAKVAAAKQNLENANASLATAEKRWRIARSDLIDTQTKNSPAPQDILLMVILMGALGGFAHLASSLSMYIGNRGLRRSWIVYYLLAPLQGAALAPIIYLLFTSALTSQAGGASTGANLNLTGIYAFAALTGLFSKQAIEKLAEVFATFFTKVTAKDPLIRG